jgi:hypothetical protein
LHCSNVRPLAAGRQSPPMKFLPSKPLMERHCGELLRQSR